MKERTFLLSKLLRDLVWGGGGGGKFQFIFELLVLASSLRHCIFCMVVKVKKKMKKKRHKVKNIKKALGTDEQIYLF